jgi:uncharacterized membrane protein
LGRRGWLLTATLLFVLGGALVALMLRAAQSASKAPRNARQLLDLQFARGELSIEEYERRRRVIDRS